MESGIGREKEAGSCYLPRDPFLCSLAEDSVGPISP